MESIFESKDLKVYKRLIELLGTYCLSLPATQAQKYYDLAIKNGGKIIPKDGKAISILNSILSSKESTPTKVQKLLNIRFSDLPIDKRPLNKDSRRVFVAFWMGDGKVCDKVLDLINFELGESGYWCDMKGNKVKLMDK
jgi:hypothetical protein